MLDALSPRGVDAKLAGIIKLAVMAVGGQGGGVLAGWIEDVARGCGYVVQATSVAGVAQRTGATIYYLEMAPKAARDPVFALLPAAGDVDIVIAAEMMEAGRAIIRGFVTPDRTTLIASTHRALAVSEKMVPGDGIADADEVRAAAEVAAQRVVMLDMEALAVAAGSVISASLFGALAGSGALPFPREAYEAAIQAGGKGVAASQRAFVAGYEGARGGGAAVASAVIPAKPAAVIPANLAAGWQGLQDRLARLPAPVMEMAGPGLRKVVDFQDLAYGAAYLGHVEAVLVRDEAARGFVLAREAAKYIANAMAYDDVIRVADLKTRGARFARIRGEMGAKDANLLYLTEFMHPRAEEIAGMLPAAMGARVEASAVWMGRLERWFGRGRHLRTDGLVAFGALYLLGGMRGWRLRTRRHAVEVAHMAVWLNTAMGYLPRYDLAVEVLRCRRLIKGYSDTHARGLSKFDRVVAGIARVQAREDGPHWARRLREAALMDEAGVALDGALQTIASFA